MFGKHNHSRTPTGRLQRVQAQLGPYAATARDTAAHRVADARRWAAPRLEQAAHTVQDTVAPKVSDLLTATAHKVEPVQREVKRRGRRARAELRKSRDGRGRRRWPAVLLVVGGVAAAVAALLGRRRPEGPGSATGEPRLTDEAAESPGSGEPTETTMDGQVRAP